ncbi:MAG: Rieske 2Fe-2S domain-containing protein [Planctomycetes bacterium]|nr:Rieske 2Fe-2S domain-containing protein [Planctomycetota bacterium]
MENAEKINVGKAEILKEGVPFKTKVGKHPVIVVKWNGGLFAYKDYCPHEFETLATGYVEDGRIVCKAHGYCFEMDSGNCVKGDNALKLTRFEVTVENGDLMVSRSPL